MKPKITFDKSAAKFVLESLARFVDKNGYVSSLKWMGKDKAMETRKEKCGICKKDIHIKHFAGIIKNIGFVCDNISCLVAISDHIKEKNEQKHN
jgi:hypothetical protein